MKRLIPFIFLLISCMGARADRITAAISFTQNPLNGSNLVVNANTRRFITVVTTPSTQIAVTNSIANAVTNLFRHFQFSPWDGTLSAQSIISASQLNLYGSEGRPLTVTIGGSWATVVYTTNFSTSGQKTVTVPGSAMPEAQRTNIFTLLTTALNDYSLISLDQDSAATLELVGLANAQTIAGAKRMTNDASRFENGVVSNIVGHTIHFTRLDPPYSTQYDRGLVFHESVLSGGSQRYAIYPDQAGYPGIYLITGTNSARVPASIAAQPESILNQLVASNKFGGLAWANFWTWINQFAAISNSFLIDSTGTNLTINGGIGNTNTLNNPFFTGNAGMGVSPMIHPASLDRGITFTNGTSASTDPLNGVSIWSSGGSGFYRGSSAAGGSGANDQWHNQAAQVTGAGSDFTEGTSYAFVDFGGTDAELNALPTAGTYWIHATVTVTADAANAGDSFFAKLYNATDASDIANSEKKVSNIAEGATDIITLDAIATFTAAKRIQIYSKNTSGARGTVTAIYTQIQYVRLY